MLFGAVLGYAIIAIFGQNLLLRVIAAGAAGLDLGAYFCYRQLYKMDEEE